MDTEGTYLHDSLCRKSGRTHDDEAALGEQALVLRCVNVHVGGWGGTNKTAYQAFAGIE